MSREPVEDSVLFYPREYYVEDQNGQKHCFETEIRATPETIDEIMKARNLGEVCQEWNPKERKRPPEEMALATLLETRGFTPGALHMACFVGFLALKSGAASVEEVLGDCGLVHEIAHNMSLGEGQPCIARREDVVRMARRIEQAIPGHPYQ